ncbi:MAG TPA: hypothetical protein VF631_07520 [Allosphingosinicella sp.]
MPGANRHGWVAIDDATGFAIDLPQGGTGAYIGRYPEIAAYLATKGLAVALDYSRARGDQLDADHGKGVYTWTFETGGGIVVKDIPRVMASITVQL